MYTYATHCNTLQHTATHCLSQYDVCIHKKEKACDCAKIVDVNTKTSSLHNKGHRLLVPKRVCSFEKQFFKDFCCFEKQSFKDTFVTCVFVLRGLYIQKDVFENQGIRKAVSVL